MRNFWKVALLLSVFSTPVLAAIGTPVADPAIAHSSGATTIVLTTTSNCSGMMLVVGKYGGNVTSTPITDSHSNTYTLLSSDLYNTNHRVYVWAAQMTTPIISGDTITIGAWSGSVTNDFGAVCATGLATSSAEDIDGNITTGSGKTGNSTGPNQGGQPDVTSGVLSVADELEFCISAPDAFIGSYTTDATNGWTNVGGIPSGSRQTAIDYKIVAATTSTPCRPVFTTGQWLVGIWTFKAAAGGGTPVVQPMTLLGVNP